MSLQFWQKHIAYTHADSFLHKWNEDNSKDLRPRCKWNTGHETLISHQLFILKFFYCQYRQPKQSHNGKKVGTARDGSGFLFDE